MDYQPYIDKAFRRVSARGNRGQIASYIPELARVSPDKFGVHLLTRDGASCSTGDCDEKFSIQSIAKVLSLCLAYRLLGNDLWQRVGVEPSGTPFNSLVQLEADRGIPRNPFLNAGALVICDVLISALKKPATELLAFIRDLSGLPDLRYNATIAASERAEGYRNIALTNFIRSFGNIENKLDDVLDLYFHLCSIEMSCAELSRTFLFLASGGKQPNGETILTSGQAKRINAMMLTCGFYDEAGEFAYRVGLPGKSGVGGGIVALHPDQYVITVWSPRLNPKGNSYRGVRFLEQFTTETASSIF